MGCNLQISPKEWGIFNHKGNQLREMGSHLINKLQLKKKKRNNKNPRFELITSAYQLITWEIEP